MAIGEIRHMCLDVQGWLSRVSSMPKRQREREASAWTLKSGRHPCFEEVRDFLYGHLLQGHRVIPMGDCDNFDWETGCRGHKPAETATGGE